MTAENDTSVAADIETPNPLRTIIQFEKRGDKIVEITYTGSANPEEGAALDPESPEVIAHLAAAADAKAKASQALWQTEVDKRMASAATAAQALQFAATLSPLPADKAARLEALKSYVAALTMLPNSEAIPDIPA